MLLACAQCHVLNLTRIADSLTYGTVLGLNMQQMSGTPHRARVDSNDLDILVPQVLFAAHHGVTHQLCVMYNEHFVMHLELPVLLRWMLRCMATHTAVTSMQKRYRKLPCKQESFQEEQDETSGSHRGE